IARIQTGRYQVEFRDLYGWSRNLSLVPSVTAHGAGTIDCAATSWRSEFDRTIVEVGCNDFVTKAPFDSLFSVMLTSNHSLEAPSAFAMSDYTFTRVSPYFSWSSTKLGPQSITKVATGDFNVLMGTGNTPKSAKIVTALGAAGSICLDAKGISGGLEVRCYDENGAPADRQVSVGPVAGGRPGQRLRFAPPKPATPGDAHPA